MVRDAGIEWDYHFHCPMVQVLEYEFVFLHTASNVSSCFNPLVRFRLVLGYKIELQTWLEAKQGFHKLTVPLHMRS